MIDRLRQGLNHWLRHLARVLFAYLLVSLVWLVSIQQDLLLTLLVTPISLRFFWIYKLEVGFDDVRVLLHLLVKLHLTLMLSLLVNVYIWEVSPHFRDTLFMLFDSFFVVYAGLFELFILHWVEFFLTINDAHECLFPFLIFLLNDRLLILPLLVLLLLILLELIDLFVHCELVLLLGLRDQLLQVLLYSLSPFFLHFSLLVKVVWASQKTRSNSRLNVRLPIHNKLLSNSWKGIVNQLRLLQIVIRGDEWSLRTEGIQRNVLLRLMLTHCWKISCIQLRQLFLKISIDICSL